MSNKPQKSWGEIQLAIASVSITATMAFWNLFAAPVKQRVVARPADTATPPPTEMPTQAIPPIPAFIPIKIIFGGVAAPKQQVVVQSSSPATSSSKKKTGGSGSSAPPPTTNTGSSKP